MFAKVYSAVVVGMEAVPVEVEVELMSGFIPSFTIVGLPDKAVQESRERVMASVRKVLGEWPWKKVVVNLAPADIPKAGASFDLPIAVGVLAASQGIKIYDNSLFVGELNLRGEVRGVKGVLSILESAGKKGFEKIYIPSENRGEASWTDLQVYPVQSLHGLISCLKDSGSKAQSLKPIPKNYGLSSSDQGGLDDMVLDKNPDAGIVDFAEVNGQIMPKRAMEIAAAGRHNILLIGPPGAGKTMLARALPTILPPLELDERLEVTKIYSVSGLLKNNSKLVTQRPFRRPHHTASTVSIVGGGAVPQPGEISLAHKGVLFLDEFAEFSTFTINSLRQPVEDGNVTIARKAGTVTFPADFMLVCATNPCPCGWHNDRYKKCTCSVSQVKMYQKRLSGPVLDRIDLAIWVNKVEPDEFNHRSSAENSAQIRKRIIKSVEFRNNREKTSRKTNLDSSYKVKNNVDDSAWYKLKRSVGRLSLSARAFYRTIRVARTIADLNQDVAVSDRHISEALQFRSELLFEK